MSVDDLVKRHGDLGIQIELKVAQLLDQLATWGMAEFGSALSDKGREQHRTFIRQRVEEMVGDSVILESIHFMKLAHEDGHIKMRFGGDIRKNSREDIPPGYGVLS